MLKAQADAFAGSIAAALSAFTGQEVVVAANGHGDKLLVSDDGGVRLRVGSRASLWLAVHYGCRLDSAGKYLKVVDSRIAVHAGAGYGSDPLFRYEYDASKSRQLPASHFQIHAHRDQFTRVMTLAAISGTKRRRHATKELEEARMCNLHFPTGGSRFRPTLEDVLQFVAVEFGVKPGPSWGEVLHENRLEWRRRQTAAVVRDCPSAAVEALTDMGYAIVLPPEGARPDDKQKMLLF